ncbi:MAG: hypothetical protein P1V19_08705 [Gimesia sp.]|nr:hypothetical protein [Gimesia sp.]
MNQLERQQKHFSFAMKLAIFHFLLNPVLLFVGIGAAGAGHGSSQLWYFALGSCFLFNLTLLNTVVASFLLRKLNKKMTTLFYVLLTLFLAYAGISIWVSLNPGRI